MNQKESYYMASKKRITTKEEYNKQLAYLENLARKGEANLSEEEISIIANLAEEVEAYEDQHLMGEDLVTAKDVQEEEPNLIEIVEFTMFKRKLTRAKLAELLGLPASKVSQILNGKREPDVSFLKSIHQKLDIDGNFILESV